ncbi:hypothetical protein [Hyphococcus sp.]|uniref:hypothetical protein n=1 Tax=Hyphococcus sp. TaxID=2038636 RepID=UPI00208D2DF9|nr:MAG: hypothetical protein DHS20C04_08770 [Marinicaulis sp.]
MQYGIVSNGAAMNANAFTHNLVCRIEAAHVTPSSVWGGFRWPVWRIKIVLALRIIEVRTDLT